MTVNCSLQRPCLIALVAVLMLVAVLACGPGLDGAGGTEPLQPSGDDAAGPSDDVAAPTATVTATTSIPIAPSPTPTQEQPMGDGVFERAFYDPS